MDRTLETIIVSVFYVGVKIWSLSVTDTHKLRALDERKFLRKIFEPNREEAAENNCIIRC
jgi:hypothetical protein